MILPIVKYGDPILTKKALPVTEFDEKLRKLVEDMFETMYAAPGVGLAGPQVGVLKRMFVMDCSSERSCHGHGYVPECGCRRCSGILS